MTQSAFSGKLDHLRGLCGRNTNDWPTGNVLPFPKKMCAHSEHAGSWEASSNHLQPLLKAATVNNPRIRGFHKYTQTRTHTQGVAINILHASTFAYTHTHTCRGGQKIPISLLCGRISIDTPGLSASTCTPGHHTTLPAYS